MRSCLRTIGSSPDVQRLQNDINQLSIWSQGALMSFNADKCAVLRLHPLQAKNNNPQYQLNGRLLRCVSHQRDLGAIVDETLKPNRQCAKAAKNATSIMRTIKASFIDIRHFSINYMERSSAPTWNTHSKPGDRG